MRHTRNVMLRLFTALLLVGTLVTTTGADPHKDEAHGNEGKGNKASQEKRRSKAKDWESHGHDGYFPAHGYTTLGIPPVICPRPVNVVCGVPPGLRVTNRPRNTVSTCAITRRLVPGSSSGPRANLGMSMSPCMMRISPASS